MCIRANGRPGQNTGDRRAAGRRRNGSLATGSDGGRPTESGLQGSKSGPFTYVAGHSREQTASA
jgi:hypothetical protein